MNEDEYYLTVWNAELETEPSLGRPLDADRVEFFALKLVVVERMGAACVRVAVGKRHLSGAKKKERQVTSSHQLFKFYG